jgi:type II secretory ATPase GspE/PulE/Tfp pilus assembly ATPase PilB-like protein
VVLQPNQALHAELISRLKIMAILDISEKRLPQDGRICLRKGSRAVVMGVGPFLLSSSLLGVLGQRLVRQRFTACHGVGEAR